MTFLQGPNAYSSSCSFHVVVNAVGYALRGGVTV